MGKRALVQAALAGGALLGVGIGLVAYLGTRRDAEGQLANAPSAALPATSPDLAVGADVVVAIAPASMRAGRVSRLEGDHVTVTFDGHPAVSADRTKVVAMTARVTAAEPGEYLLRSLGKTIWQGCRVEAIEGRLIRCTDIAGRSLSLDPVELLRPGKELEREIADYGERHHRFRVFDAALGAAGPPLRPLDWRPDEGEAVLALGSEGSWFERKVVRVEAAAVYLDGERSAADDVVGFDEVVPLPGDAQHARPGQVCLVRPTQGGAAWEPHLVEAVTGSLYRVSNRAGIFRQVSDRDILPLSYGAPEPDAPYVPSPIEVVDAMLELAGVTADDIVYDLGCGDGRILIQAAKKYHARAVGFDIDPNRVVEARANAERAGVAERVRIVQADIFDVDLRDATVVTLYLSTELNTRLLPQLRKLPRGARIVSHDFEIAGLLPDRTIEMTTGQAPAQDVAVTNSPAVHSSIHLWRAPLK